ncbi:MAG: glycosyl hydrolase family 28 protein [Bacillota bacterium]|nr:glycosyl hydrolase family 28 protein [Bacillota bacterium]
MGISVSITDFGAKCDGTVQTDKIQSAIDYCYLQGGGEVMVPEGIFVTGGLRIRSDVTLHLMEGACIKGTRNPLDYFGYLKDELQPLDPNEVFSGRWKRASERTREDFGFITKSGSRWNNALIRAIHAQNVAIIGEKNSCIDGSNCYDSSGEEYYRGPHAISMHFCENIILKGYTVKDSSNWAHNINSGKNILMDKVKVKAGHDGAHFTLCDNIKVSDCEFYTGDDCIAGFSNLNVYVSGCMLNSACSALRFGGTNVLIEKCRMYGPCKYLFRGSLTLEEKIEGSDPVLAGHRNNMLSAFTYYADFSVPIAHDPQNITIKDCKIENADRFLHYNFSGNEPWQKGSPLLNIRFENIKASGISMPLTAYGDKDTKVSVEFKNVDFSFREGYEETSFMHLCFYKKVIINNVTITNAKSNPLIKTWSDGDIEIENLKCDVPEESLIKRATEDFKCLAI